MGIWGFESLANDWGSDLRLDILKELGLDVDYDKCDREDCCFCEDVHDDWYFGDSCELPTKEHIEKFTNTILPVKLQKMEKSPCKNEEAHCLALFIVENNIKVSKATNKKIIVALYEDNFYTWPEPEKRKKITVDLVNKLIALQKSQQ